MPATSRIKQGFSSESGNLLKPHVMNMHYGDRGLFWKGNGREKHQINNGVPPSFFSLAKEMEMCPVAIPQPY